LGGSTVAGTAGTRSWRLPAAGLRLDLGAAAGGPVGEVVVLLLGVRELGSSDVVAEFILPAS
jgi:hypothetical protein